MTDKLESTEVDPYIEPTDLWLRNKGNSMEKGYFQQMMLGQQDIHTQKVNFNTDLIFFTYGSQT